MRRAVKISLWGAGIAVCLVLVLAAAVLVIGNTAPGRAWIERLTDRLTAGHVKLSGLGGSFPADLTLARLQLADREGVWLSADRITLRWSPTALLERQVRVGKLQVARVDVERGPVTEPSGGSVSIPHIDVARLSIDVLHLSAELAGTAATFSIHGSVDLRSLEDASADLVAHRTDSDGEYSLHLRFDPQRADASLTLHEPASGPLENILKLPGLGALSATLRLNGPRRAERLEVVLDAGDLHARAEGNLDLLQRSADVDYSLEAPALSPHPDVAWQRLSSKGRWHGNLSEPAAEARVDVVGLRLAGATLIGALGADLTASGGGVALDAVVKDLVIPGPQPKMFATDPITIHASLRLNEPTRPLLLTATQRLFSLRAQVVTAGEQSATLDLHLPNVAPFAALAQQDVRGDATITAKLVRLNADVGVTMDAKAGLSGGTAPWIDMLGNRLGLQLSGSMSDAAINVTRLQLTGRALTLSMTGTATRSPAPAKDYIKELQARWDLKISDLATIASELAGELQARGRLSGPPTSLLGDAEVTSTLSLRGSPPGTLSAEVQARGLPSAPSGTLRVHGIVDSAPLTVDLSLDRDARRGVHAVVREADWKSARAQGDMTVESSIAESKGQLHLSVGNLADLDRLLGMHIGGSLDGSATFTPAGGRTRAQFVLDGRDLATGTLTGNVHLTGEGPTNAVALQLAVQVPHVNGAAGAAAAGSDSAAASDAADASSTAILDLDARELRVASAAAHYRGEELKLLSPTRVSFANGVSIDHLKLGAQDAIFRLGGELAPNLDIRASARPIGPKLINLFMPDLLAQGTIEARARLQGRLSAPTGEVILDATGIRFADPTAVGLPALDLHARSDLTGIAASIQARLSTGSQSLLTVEGEVPLDVDGAVDLQILGNLDVGLANPLMEARGMHAGGKLAVDATVGGSASAPKIRGTVSLAQGNWRDYVRGVNLSNINAEVEGSEGTLQIKSFKATAASGPVTMTGSVGVLQPGIPVDLKITASKAQPVAGSIVTANLDADLSIRGKARERVDLSGKIHVNRATIGIPDALPPDVAVLDVRRRGQRALPPAGKLVIALDVTINAPRQILVQGRGLDAELGGSVHLGGTLDAPLVSGGFELQRGSLSIGGTRLNLQTTPPGLVSFDGAGLKRAIDPTLDFTARTTVSSTGTDVTLHISGHADSPTIELTSASDPGESQDQLMALLLFGKPASQLNAFELAQIGYALANLTGVGGGSNVLVKLQRSLGLDRLSVGSDTTTSPTGTPVASGAAIEAGRYVSQRVYIEGKQTTTGSSQVQVDIDLTKRLKLTTRLGNGTAITQGTTPENDPGSSVGLSYQFEY
jgi:translocation and assembly module TamB